MSDRDQVVDQLILLLLWLAIPGVMALGGLWGWWVRRRHRRRVTRDR